MTRWRVVRLRQLVGLLNAGSTFSATVRQNLTNSGSTWHKLVIRLEGDMSGKWEKTLRNLAFNVDTMKPGTMGQEMNRAMLQALEPSEKKLRRLTVMSERKQAKLNAKALNRSVRESAAVAQAEATPSTTTSPSVSAGEAARIASMLASRGGYFTR